MIPGFKSAVRFHLPRPDNLDENPLYLALSGRAYRRSNRFLKPGSDILRVFQKPFSPLRLPGYLALWPPFTLIGLLILSRPVISAKSIERILRQQAREGRLMDLYLAMTPEDLAHALLHERFRRLNRNGKVLKAVVVGILAPGCFIYLNYFNLFYAGINGAIVLLAIACVVDSLNFESFLTDAENLKGGLLRAGGSDKSFSNSVRGMADKSIRGLYAIFGGGGVLALTVLISAVVLNFLPRGNLWDLGLTGAFVFVSFPTAIAYRIAYFHSVDAMVTPPLHRQITMALEENLPNIIEANPPLE